MSSPAVDRIPLGYEVAAESLRENPGQWAAYESMGNAVVLAGPGSGKTKTLVTKVARILHEDLVRPQRVACVTYSNACVSELKDRFAAVGVSDAAPLYVGTVHSFCLTQVLLPFARLAGAGLPEPIAVASGSEQRAAFRAALDHTISRDERPSTWKTRFDKYRRTHVDATQPAFQGDDAQLAALTASAPARGSRAGPRFSVAPHQQRRLFLELYPFTPRAHARTAAPSSGRVRGNNRGQRGLGKWAIQGSNL